MTEHFSQVGVIINAVDRFLELMAVDKRVLDGRLRLVLLKGIGMALVTDGFPLQVLRDTLEAA